MPLRDGQVRSSRKVQQLHSSQIFENQTRFGSVPCAADYLRVSCESHDLTHPVGSAASSGRCTDDGRVVVKDLLLRHNRLSREWLAELVVWRMCRKRCRNPVSLHPHFSNSTQRFLRDRRWAESRRESPFASLPADAGQCFVLIGPLRNCVTTEASREDEKIV